MRVPTPAQDGDSLALHFELPCPLAGAGPEDGEAYEGVGVELANQTADRARSPDEEDAPHARPAAAPAAVEPPSGRQPAAPGEERRERKGEGLAMNRSSENSAARARRAASDHDSLTSLLTADPSIGPELPPPDANRLPFAKRHDRGAFRPRGQRLTLQLSDSTWSHLPRQVGTPSISQPLARSLTSRGTGSRRG